MKTLLTLEEASIYLNVSKPTLRRWDRIGKLKSERTGGGHRRYTIESLDKIKDNKNNDSILMDLYESICTTQNIGYNAVKQNKIEECILIQIDNLRNIIGNLLLQSYIKV